MIVTARVRVGSVPVKVAERGIGDMTSQPSHDWGARSFVIKNLTGTATVYLGGSSAVAANGFPWEVADGPWPRLDLEPGEELWGVSAGDTQELATFRQGR